MISNQLTVHTTPAILQTETSRPPMTIKHDPAAVTMTKSGTDYLSISSVAAKLFIDQSKAFEEVNLKKITQLTKEWANQGKAAVMDYTATKAQEGNQLAKIERGATIASLMKQKNRPDAPASNITFMPSSIDRVRIHVQPGKLQLTAPDTKLHVNVDANALEISIPKWESRTRLAQKHSISFSVQTTT